MSHLNVIGHILGGIAFFLLGIDQMRSGLHSATGHSLRRLLYQRTPTQIRGLVAGFLSSALLQSASAVILTTMNFVDVRILTLRQALPMVVGANLGKIAVSWLLVSIGLKFELTPYVLPALALSILIMATFPKRFNGLGRSMTGLWLVFFGIDLIKGHVPLLRQDLVDLIGLLSHQPLIICSLAGTLIAIITQSSSAALAITLSAVHAGWLDLSTAAAIIVGFNLGTTSNALVAASHSTPNGRRIALGHLGFNFCVVLTGWLSLYLLGASSENGLLIQWIKGDPILGLTSFYSLLILATAAWIMPLIPQFTTLLKRTHQRSAPQSQPQHIKDRHAPDWTTLVRHLRAEIVRLGTMSSDILRESLVLNVRQGWIHGPDLGQKEFDIDVLNEHIHKYASHNGQLITEERQQQFIQTLCRASQHFGFVSDLSHNLSEIKNRLVDPIDATTEQLLREWSDQVSDLLPGLGKILESGHIDDMNLYREPLKNLEQQRTQLRYHFIQQSVSGQMGSTLASALIDVVEMSRRGIKELTKGIYKIWTPDGVTQANLTGEISHQATVASNIQQGGKVIPIHPRGPGEKPSV